MVFFSTFQVLSGCEWGNILVWEAGLVKLEVTQKGRKVCHSAPIVSYLFAHLLCLSKTLYFYTSVTPLFILRQLNQIQFMLSPAGDEVTTIARDGCVRSWYWDSVDQADPPEDDPFVELNPVAETCVREKTNAT